MKQNAIKYNKMKKSKESNETKGNESMQSELVFVRNHKMVTKWLRIGLQS